MTNMELYNRIENPLDRKDFLQDLIDIYKYGGSFMSRLTSVYQNSMEMRYNPKACDELYSTLFNKWKKRMTTRTKEEWNKVIADGSVEKDVFELVEYLKTVPDVKTEKEANNIIFGQEDKKMRELMSKYGCFSSSWNFGTYLESNRTTAFKDKKYKTEHRLYINVPGVYQHEFIRKFIDICEERNLPYYLKYYEDWPRDDSFIIYCNTQHLLEYIKALEEMEKRYPDLIENIKTPPFLTGKINRWIGYGSEPLHKRDSYNGKRADILEKIIDDFVIEWYKEHRDIIIHYKGKNVSYWQYAAEKLLDEEIKRAKKDPEFSAEKDYFYFDGKHLDNKEYMTWLRNILIKNSEKAFDCWLNGRCLSTCFERNGKKVGLSEDYYALYWKEYMKSVLKVNPNLAEKLMKKIKEKAAPNHIDSEKYCFDIEHLRLLMDADKILKKEQVKQTSKKESLEPQARRKETTSTYKPMTEEEIRASREKLGINVSQGQNTNQQGQPYRIKFNKGKPIADERKTSTIKTKQGYVLEPMTDEQIKASREKIAKTAPVYQKK